MEDEGWHKAARRYELFLRRHQDMRILFLELGVGYNTPGIIKYPFWQMSAENPKAVYACVNYGETYVPEEIAKRSICINADIGEILKQLKDSRFNFITCKIAPLLMLILFLACGHNQISSQIGSLSGHMIDTIDLI